MRLNLAAAMTSTLIQQLNDVCRERDKLRADMVADLRRLADRIEREHPVAAPVCPCCMTDAIYLRDLASKYEKGHSDHA